VFFSLYTSITIGGGTKESSGIAQLAVLRAFTAAEVSILHRRM
jgi:hypothetical protein